MVTLEAVREKEYRHNKFLAALKGVDLDEGSKKESMERVAEEMQRIEAEQGVTSSPQAREQNEFTTFGIAVVEGE